MAITSLMRIGDLQALSISPSCLDFAPGLVKVILHPHPNYLPKVPWIRSFLKLSALRRSRHRRQERLHLLCPVRALHIYVHRTSQWCKSEQLFICYGGCNRGVAATKHTVSHWVRDAIALAYEARGQASPLTVRAHSTRGVASSMALARGAPLQQVCDAAGWSSPHTFVRVSSLKCSCYSGLARPWVDIPESCLRPLQCLCTHYTTLGVQTLPVRRRWYSRSHRGFSAASRVAFDKGTSRVTWP